MIRLKQQQGENKMDEKMNTLVFEDEKGQKHELKVYFTYTSERTEKDYVVFYDEHNPEELLAGVINEDGSVGDIETDEEYEELDEVIESYQNEHEND